MTGYSRPKLKPPSKWVRIKNKLKKEEDVHKPAEITEKLEEIVFQHYENPR